MRQNTTYDTTWIYLHTAIPKNIAITIYVVYVWHNGVIATETVEITKQTLLTKSALTWGKSAKYPQATLPIVFVIPIIDNRKEALPGSIP